MKSNNKNKLGLPLIFMLVHLIMFGCTNPPDNTISIGVVMPLTGVLSEPGNNIVEGIELALSKYNSSCSDTNYKIKLIIEDSKS